MDPLEIVQSTGDPAFATDEEGRVVIWNKEAERLLGYAAVRALGKPCHEVLCGRDVFGNRFCDADCNLAKMVQRDEPIHRFEMDFRRASGEVVRAAVSVLCVRGPRRSQFTLIHLLQRVDRSSTEVLPVEPGVGITSTATIRPDRPPLTAREIEVLRTLALGSNTREIADMLSISVATVRTHIQNILEKLDVHSQVQAVAIALRDRLI
ncbi:MAG: PAS domain-containing protein [Acidobacteria bacterium]|nr:PAS domain-containing protein [Acidobacteriota bacterium]NIQ30659.1 PAS domain-containing protein [Acidobacteriota bacterium]NIQ85617.1 PAS domain-containing protein [Acidobacteriota bacterium]